MTTPLKEPNPGDKISASYMRELVRYVRSLYPIAGHGVRVSRGANGTVIACEAEAKADAAKDKGCFAIKTVSLTTDDEGNVTMDVTLERCWFQCGGRTHGKDLMSIQGFTGGVLALKYDTTQGDPSSTATLAGFLTMASMQEYQRNYTDDMVIPIYQLDGTTVVADFRIGVSAAQYEFEDEGTDE